MEWINPKDKLPEEFKDVLIYSSQFNPPLIAVNQYFARSKTFRRDYDEFYEIDEIDFWCEIELPKLDF